MLTGRVAVVTGGGSGIGAATAALLAREGACVVIAGRSAERGEAQVRSIPSGNGSAVFVQTDVTDATAVTALMNQAVEKYGRIDVLFNNSGVEVPEELSGPGERDWDRLFATNVKGTWLCCKEAIPHLLRTRGVIVNNASMAGLIGVAGSVGYAASKAAVVSLTRSLALGYASQGLRVNAICPGPIATQMTWDEWEAAGGPEEGRRRADATCPARRIGEPEEVARLVVYLASDAASFITGAAIPIDGGKTAGLMPIERYRW
jgi:NAD(P)-dependent dehydrogenase (short-subunit alcohol dehydrogenase family)